MKEEQAIFNLEIKKKSGLSINPDIHHSKVFSSELKTLEWDILNPDYLIWVSNGHAFDFLLKPFFLGYRREKSKTGFSKLESSSHIFILSYMASKISNLSAFYTRLWLVEFYTLFRIHAEQD